jgi:spermidine synthase
MPLLKIPFYKRLLSNIYPVLLWKGSSSHNAVLELFFYQNNYQLATSDAVYSDGTNYRPLVLAFDELKKMLPSINEVLVLGTGLGSAVQILNKLGKFPSFTLVDNDKVILKMAEDILPKNNKKFVCSDAGAFLDSDNNTYDLLIADIFNNRVVPEAFTTDDFFRQCNLRLNPNGHFIFNYIVHDDSNWDKISSNIHDIFPSVKILKEGINRIIVARA